MNSHATEHQPNILFVVLDAHRCDPLGCYGSERGISPNLDAFADQATVYERAIAPAQWTIPSHASMFTGVAASEHLMVQSKDALPPGLPTLAELLKQAGYRTMGFCNNPLVGVLDNGLRRGFDRFYNYGGAFSARPRFGRWRKGTPVLDWLRRHVLKRLRRIAERVQNAVAQSGAVLRFFLHPRLVPLWTRHARFKGDTPRSLHDLTRSIQERERYQGQQPWFAFVNLMETHLPYTPPRRFVAEFAPIIDQDPAAARFMRYYNTLAAEWLLPMAEPFTEMQSQVLHRLYDAEAAYQDHCLAPLLAELDTPARRQDTLVIFCADHGEMLGEHQFMGHGLSVHEELVHVPLIVRSPGQREGARARQTVSTTRLFHTMLAAAGVDVLETDGQAQAAVGLAGKPVVSEAYSPTNVTEIIERRCPQLFDRFHARLTHRAIYRESLKLIDIEGGPKALYDLSDDPGELHPVASGPRLAARAELAAELAAFLARTRPAAGAERSQEVVEPDDEVMRRRLRGLGYLD